MTRLYDDDNFDELIVRKPYARPDIHKPTKQQYRSEVDAHLRGLSNVLHMLHSLIHKPSSLGTFEQLEMYKSVISDIIRANTRRP